MDSTMNILEEIEGRINTLVAAWREAFAKNDLGGCHANEALIGEELKEYKRQSLNVALYNLKKEADPMRKAVELVTYGTKRFKHDRVEGVEVGAHIEPSTDRLNLVQVAKYCGKPTDFQYDIEKLAQLVAVRVVEDLNEELDERKAAEVARIKAKYRISDKGRKLDDGPNPTSNTQLVNRVQALVDKVFPGGALKVMNRDIAFILNGFTKVSKEVGTIDIGQSKLMLRLFTDMMNRKVTNANYAVIYKETKQRAEAEKTDAEKAEAPKTEEQKTEEPKTEAPKTEEPKAEAQKAKKSRSKKAA